MKIRTDFVTNSSSSSFIVYISIGLETAGVISWRSPMYCCEINGELYLNKSPRELAQCETINELVKMLRNSVYVYEEGHSAFKSNSAFIRQLQQLSSMNEIQYIEIEAHEYYQSGRDYYRKYTYNLNTDKYVMHLNGSSEESEGTGGEELFDDTHLADIGKYSSCYCFIEYRIKVKSGEDSVFRAGICKEVNEYIEADYKSAKVLQGPEEIGTQTSLLQIKEILDDSLYLNNEKIALGELLISKNKSIKDISNILEISLMVNDAVIDEYGTSSYRGMVKYVYSFESAEANVYKKDHVFDHSEGAMVELLFVKKEKNTFVRKVKPVIAPVIKKDIKIEVKPEYQWMFGKIFVHTGLTKKEERAFEGLIIANGGIIKSSTVLKTDYLVYNADYDHETTKLRKAKELISEGKNIILMTYVDFLKKIYEETSDKKDEVNANDDKTLVQDDIDREEKNEKKIKQEPKKQEQKKQEIKKQEPKKQEAKKQEPKKQESPKIQKTESKNEVFDDEELLQKDIKEKKRYDNVSTITIKEVPFDKLDTSDLILDCIYKGGPVSNMSSEPFHKLIPGCGNSGGFRKKLREDGSGQCAYVVLYTSMEEKEWPDYLDEDTGIFKYYGDNRKPGNGITKTRKGGNLILEEVFDRLDRGINLKDMPPFLVFKKTGNGRDIRFLGLAVPGNPNLSPNEELVAKWYKVNGQRFENYEAYFTILNTGAEPISRKWIEMLIKDHKNSMKYAPDAWLKFIRKGRSGIDALTSEKKVKLFSTTKCTEKIDNSSSKTRELSSKTKTKIPADEKDIKAKLDRIYAKYRRKITRSNDEILGNKPINRSNDSRIKVIINNTQELMQQYEEEVMNLAIQFEEKANLLNEYDEELVLVIDQIICCYEALKVGYEVEFLHWRKDIIKCSKSNSDSEIKKWKKKKEELPSMMLLKLEAKENELITKEKNIDNKIIQNQKKQKKHKASIDKLAEKIYKNNDSIAEKITEREKIHKNIEKINAEELDIEKKIIDLRKQRDNLNENKTALEAEANSIQGEIDKCISSLNGIKTEYTQKRNSLKGEADRINFEKQTLFNLYKDYAERMEIEKKKAEKSFFLKKKHLREASIIEKSIESVNEQKAHLEDKLEDIEARHKNIDFSYEAKIKEIEDQIESLKAKENSIKEQISTTNNMIEDINESIISLSDTSEFNESKKKKCEDEIKEIQEQESQLIELNNSLSEEQTDLEKSLEDLEQQNQELQDKKKNIEMQVNENKQKEKEIKKKISEYKKNSENPV